MSDLSAIMKKTTDFISPKYEVLKQELDKYVNAFELKFDKEKGYVLIINFDVVIQLQENPIP